MARRLFAALVGCAIALSAAGAEEDIQSTLDELRARVERLEQGREDVLAVRWKDGLKFEGAGYKGSIGGRIHLDSFSVHHVDKDLRYGTAPAASDDWKSGAKFRRVWLNTQGEIRPEGDLPVKYKLQVDFAGPGVSYQDIYLELSDLPVVRMLRIGHFKEPFGLDELIGSNDTTFVERSMASNTCAPGRNLGAMVGGTVSERMVHWAFGAFRGFERGGEWKATARVAASPVYEDDGEKVVYLGGAVSVRGVDDGALRYLQRPENSFSARVVDTNRGLGREFGADAEHRFGVEAATVRGPFAVQAEYMVSRVEEDDPALSDDLLFHGGYAYASLFLTPGDRRAYSRSSAAFGAVRPTRNLGDRGVGAVELAARLSYIDLQDSEVRGGKATNVTVGVNWYLNPAMRVMVNQAYTEHNRWGGAWVTMTRFQVAF